MTPDVLHEQVVAFVRAFGLLRPDATPCGQPMAVSEAHTLMELSSAPGLRQRQLAERLDLDKSTVSRLVRQLEDRGWVTRRPDDRDRRVRVLRLTRSGRSAASRLAEAQRRRFALLLEALDDDELAHAVRGLEVLVRGLRRAGAAGGPGGATGQPPWSWGSGRASPTARIVQR